MTCAWWRRRSEGVKLSVVIPAHNEEENLPRVIPSLLAILQREGIEREIILVDDNSRDGTAALIDDYARAHPEIRAVHRRGQPGFGRAIRDGLAQATGEAVAIVMGDHSDDPEDVVRMYRRLAEGCDAVFGSRFIPGASVRDYPRFKWVVNRLANRFLQLLFWSSCNDLTNAFKLYRRQVLQTIGPLQTEHFNITAELPLKTLRAGCRVAVVPVRWYGRRSGVSKLSIARMGRHYLQTALDIWVRYHPRGIPSWIWGALAGLVPLVVYWAFPNHNFSSIDPINYADAIQRGGWPVLLNPHHLLYHVVGRACWLAARGLGLAVSPMHLMQWCNGVWGAAGVVLCWSILRALSGSRLSSAGATVFAWLLASAYGYWFFSIENEVYIPPAVLALATFRLLIGLTHAGHAAQQIRWAVVVGVLTALMTGFYQTYGLWSAVVILWALRTLPRGSRLRWLCWYAVTVALGVAIAYGVAAWLTLPPAERSWGAALRWPLGYLQSGRWGAVDFQAMRLWPYGFARVVLAGRPMRDWLLSPHWSPSGTILLGSWVLVGVLATIVVVRGLRNVRGLRQEQAVWAGLLTLWAALFAVVALWIEPIDWQFWVPVLIPIALLVALAWSAGPVSRPGWERVVPAGLVASLVCVNFLTAVHPDTDRTRNTWYRLATQLHQQRLTQRDLLLMYEEVPVMYHYYYGVPARSGSLGQYVTRTPEERARAFGTLRGLIHQTLESGGRVFIAETELHPNPRRRLPFRFMSPGDYTAFYQSYEQQITPVFSFFFEGGERRMYQLVSDLNRKGG
ncbi:MAG: glycosyltransferase [Candidatus Omnitrophica bacterium]|nr:glycosyltransferase [Candidatus Omnitrophota bacterium]